MKKRIFLSSLVLVLFFNGFAQPSDHAWLETSQLKVRVNADGRLFCDDEKGAFLVPKGDSMVSLMRGAGLWFGGIDPGNNLHISAQTEDPVNTDIVAGLRGIPNSGRVWKVTREEIFAHLEDYSDNWVIDNPIPSIFGWPAFRNKFFPQHNGFVWPDSMSKFTFFDDWNGQYDPQHGDFPRLSVPYLDTDWQVPSEMACFTFHTDAQTLLSTSNRPFPVQVWGQVFVFDCPENEVLSRSVFVHYLWRYEGEYRSDSSFVTVFNDTDLGDPVNDYHGFLPHHSTYFAYNSDDVDTEWANEPPLMFIDVLDYPNQIIYNPWNQGYEDRWATSTLMPYFTQADTLMPPGTRAGKAPNEFYNYMTGTWRDGTPLTVGGTGYNPGNTALPTDFAFPGYPDAPNTWTELNAQNPPRNRSSLLNFETGESRPKYLNHFTLQYTYMPWELGTLTERIKHWEAEEEYLFDRMNCCIDFVDPIPPIGCEFSFPFRPKPEHWTVFPNPAKDVVKVWHPDIYLRKMLLFDAFGRRAGVGEYRDQYSEISVQNLPSGIYFLLIEDEKGEKKTVKVVVAHGME